MKTDYENTVELHDLVIDKNSNLFGDLITDNNVIIYGTVTGNIQCSKDVILYGIVEGNIHCQNGVLLHANITGDIHCDKDLVNSENSSILGNVRAVQFDNKGVINGDVEVFGHIKLCNSSEIYGNIISKTISIEKGSITNGTIFVGAFSN